MTWQLNCICSNTQNYTFSESLFEPLQPKTKEHLSLGRGEDEHSLEMVPIGEAMMAYAPGMWSYRKSEDPLGSKAYESMISVDAQTMLLPLWSLNEDENTEDITMLKTVGLGQM